MTTTFIPDAHPKVSIPDLCKAMAEHKHYAAYPFTIPVACFICLLVKCGLRLKWLHTTQAWTSAPKQSYLVPLYISTALIYFMCYEHAMSLYIFNSQQASCTHCHHKGWPMQACTTHHSLKWIEGNQYRSPSLHPSCQHVRETTIILCNHGRETGVVGVLHKAVCQ